MELASMLAGERFSDRPASVCPVIGSILRAHNDTVDGALRGDLYRYAAEAVGTRGDFRLQLRRAAVAIAWARTRHDRRHRTLRGRLRSVPVAPVADDGPDRIARYVIRSVNRDADGHAQLLALLDELIAVGLAPALEVVELFEEERETIEDRGCGEQLVVAELA